jgi:serine/threonine kinase 32
LQSKRANFDATHELEELLLEENPLKARKRKEGQDVATMSPEFRMMEEQWVARRPATLFFYQ